MFAFAWSDVDDPRNTDNAWMETTAYHFHCSNELGALLQLRAGDDAGQVTWLDINLMTEPRYGPSVLPLRRSPVNAPLLQPVIHHIP